jgi:hypothetical protein
VGEYGEMDQDDEEIFAMVAGVAAVEGTDPTPAHETIGLNGKIVVQPPQITCLVHSIGPPPVGCGPRLHVSGEGSIGQKRSNPCKWTRENLTHVRRVA